MISVSEADVYRTLSREAWRSPYEILQLLTTPDNIHPGEVIFRLDEMVSKCFAEHHRVDLQQGGLGNQALFLFVEYRLTEDGARAKAMYADLK